MNTIQGNTQNYFVKTNYKMDNTPYSSSDNVLPLSRVTNTPDNKNNLPIGDKAPASENNDQQHLSKEEKFKRIIIPILKTGGSGLFRIESLGITKKEWYNYCCTLYAVKLKEEGKKLSEINSILRRISINENDRKKTIFNLFVVPLIMTELSVEEVGKELNNNEFYSLFPELKPNACDELTLCDDYLKPAIQKGANWLKLADFYKIRREGSKDCTDEAFRDLRKELKGWACKYVVSQLKDTDNCKEIAEKASLTGTEYHGKIDKEFINRFLLEKLKKGNINISEATENFGIVTDAGIHLLTSTRVEQTDTKGNIQVKSALGKVISEINKNQGKGWINIANKHGVKGRSDLIHLQKIIGGFVKKAILNNIETGIDDIQTWISNEYEIDHEPTIRKLKEIYNFERAKYLVKIGKYPDTVIAELNIKDNDKRVQLMKIRKERSIC